MGGKHNVLATKSLLLLVKTLFLYLKKEMADGELTTDDVVRILASREFQTAAFASFESIKEVPNELRELDFADGLELSKYIYDLSMDIVKELRV